MSAVISRILTVAWLLVASVSGVVHAQKQSPVVAVVDLVFKGEVTEGVQHALSSKLKAGLGATGMKVVADDQLRQAMGTLQQCDTAACWRLVAGKLGCRFVAGGTVAGADRSYTIELYLADGYTGKALARVERKCDICGLQAVGEKMELAASALRAKAQATRREAASVSIQTDPPGARVFVGGDAVGTSPMEIKLPAGRHEVRVAAEGYLPVKRTITTVSGVAERLEIRLIPAAPRRSYRAAVGWSFVGAGVAALGIAVVLFVVDGGQIGCKGEDQIPGGQCPELRETSAGGWTAAALGVGAGALGAYLLLTGKERRTESSTDLSPGGLSLSF